MCSMRAVLAIAALALLGTASAKGQHGTGEMEDSLLALHREVLYHLQLRFTTLWHENFISNKDRPLYHEPCSPLCLSVCRP